MRLLLPHSLPAADCPDGLSLAGSAVWRFREVVTDHGQRLSVSDLDAIEQLALSDRRPDLCGLTFDRPRIMGILNVTPDSFSDGGDHLDLKALVARARAMQGQADILDIGGESTRPGAAYVPAADEIARVVPAIRAIRAEGITTPISIDTRKAAVAEAALAAGATMVNDVSALSHDPAMASVVAAARVPVCLMHAQGDPRTMQDNPTYANVLHEVGDYLSERMEAAINAGISPDHIIVDPGLGFGKTLQHNVTILRGISHYHHLGVVVLVGASRKRFVGTVGGGMSPKDRVAGSLAVALQMARDGVQILRVHDTFETRQALNLQMAMAGDETTDGT